VQEFILDNQFSTVENDPTNTSQKEIRKVVNICTATIQQTISGNTGPKTGSRERRCALSTVRNAARNCHYSLRNNPEERSSQLLRGGSLKSRGGKQIPPKRR